MRVIVHYKSILHSVISALESVLLTLTEKESEKGQHKVPVAEALAWAAVWFLAAMAFAAWYWWFVDGAHGREVANAKTIEYVTGYLIEKALATENVFIWVTLFTYFSVPPELQKRVLLYGVIGAIVMRAALIYLGVLLIETFDWMFYVFGLFLLATGVKMLLVGGQQPDLAKNPVIRWIRSHMRVTEGYQGERFFVMQQGLRYATPLFLALVLVEVTDLIFAVDSIPAIFAITADPFLVFTSNVFAILCLRSLYFGLAGLIEKFRYLKVSLSLILALVGVKMLAGKWLQQWIGESLNFWMLGLVGGILLIGAVASHWVDGQKATPT